MAPPIVLVKPFFLETIYSSTIPAAKNYLANKTLYILKKEDFAKKALDKIDECNLDKSGRIPIGLSGNKEYYFYSTDTPIGKSKITIDFFEGPFKLSDKMEQEIYLAPKIFVIWFGGPGLYDSEDKEHDGNWANYLLPMLKWGANNLFNKNENVLWYIYKKAYTDRWSDDIKHGDATRKNHATKGVGIIADNYISHIEAKVKGYNTKRNGFYPIQIKWMDNALNFWNATKALPEKSITKVWYFGHGSFDLWLNLTHNSAHIASSPAASEIIKIDDIAKNNLQKKFYLKPYSADSEKYCSFYGCNTIKFATQWNLSYKVPAWGMNGKIDFSLTDKPGTKLDTMLQTLQSKSDGEWKEANES